MKTQFTHYELYNRTIVDPTLREHVEWAIQAAEDEIERVVGECFYDRDPNGIPGRDWLRLVSWRAADYIRVTDNAFRQIVNGPFQQESIGRYSYTVRTPDNDVTADPRYSAVLAHYTGLSSAAVQYIGVTSTRDEYSL